MRYLIIAAVLCSSACAMMTDNCGPADCADPRCDGAIVACYENDCAALDAEGVCLDGDLVGCAQCAW